MINVKKQKEKFLEDYFSICLEHGFCIDWSTGGRNILSDLPQYAFLSNELGHAWGEYQQELRESIE